MKFEQIIAAAKAQQRKVAVAAADDREVIEAIGMARAEGIAIPVLVGDAAKIKEIAKDVNVDLTDVEIVDVPDPAEASIEATKMVREGKADFLMKGFVKTALLLKAVLDKEKGLRGESGLISHVALMESPNYDRMIFMSDGGMVTYPTLEQKKGLIDNAVIVARALGVEEPKVAVLAAVEVVNEKMQPTVEAAELTKMWERGEIKNCIVNGPLAFDGAVSQESANHKGLQDNPVAGKADVVIVPNIEAGNILYKVANTWAMYPGAGVVIGAKVPIVLTSRADTPISKLYSIAAASLIADFQSKN